MFKRFFIFVLQSYKHYLSPFLPCACRYTTTCSEYMIDAIERYGILKGLCLGIKRLLRCHPWGRSGYDPVQPKEKMQNFDKTRN